MLQMENAHSEPETCSLPTQVFEIPGEPAVVINGVPNISLADGMVNCSNASSDEYSCKTICCGEWFEGREVCKFFMDRYYSGVLTKYDKETGWYRVEYEDGDSEDLDWHEVEEVLLPLDVTIPLRSLALKVVKNRQNSSHRPGQNSQLRRYIAQKPVPKEEIEPLKLAARGGSSENDCHMNNQNW